MTGETESQPEESRERGETSEGREDREEQSLEDATLDPGVLIEQSGEYQQAEAITSNFMAVVEASTPETIPTMEEVFPMEAEEPAASSEESEETRRGNAEQGENLSQGRGIIVEAEDNSPPEREQTGAGTGSERKGLGGITAIPLEVPGSGDATVTEEDSGSTEQPDQALEGGEVGPGSEADQGTSAAQVDESGTAIGTETEADQEALGEGEEGWTPPPMYAHVDSSGTVTIVDENGKPIDSPPTVTKVVGEDGTEKYMASYEADGKTYSFEVTSYISSLSDLYVGYDKDGNLTVVNGKGETVDSPPVFTKFVDDKGVEKYSAYYPGAGQGSGVVLEAYSGSLQGCYAHIGQDGKVTIVDADGNPLNSQPLTYKYVDDKGAEQITAYYPGAGESGKVTLSSYTASLQGCYSTIGQDGKITIVDADGNPLKCQPVTYKFVDIKGVEQVSAYYPGAGQGGMTTLSSYTTSLQNCYAHVGQDGKVTIVGADGKPLTSQPLTYKIVDNKGVEHIIAYYPGDATKTTLTDYLPPSGKAKSGGSV